MFIQSLEKNSDTDDIQNIKHLKNMIDRVQHLGNILKYILHTDDTKHGIPDTVLEQIISSKELDPILDAFAKEGFVFDNLSEDVRDLCKHYIENDIIMYPFDLNHHSSK